MGRSKKYKRQEVLEKAMKAFWDNGFINTSARMLEDKMGINQRTLYAEFKSKDQLFIESLQQYEQLNKEVILKPLLASDGDLEDIRTFFTDFIVAVKSKQSPNGCLFANTAMEFGTTSPEVKERLDSYFDLIYMAFFDLLTKAKSKGKLAKNTDLVKLSNYLIGCTEGLTVTVKVRDEKALLDFVDFTMNSIK
ncbi:TetR/AcrR family transcriptional regulator [Roseivirga sp. E12]|uniref:TetR/AcrR family transcriptional regulator n=1 Tax=Roseivirga sp. E12 TaxID=2819237 RepID=UPI001ABC3B6E|nr:TetR/AcrR family transcriptional regulator [Roseivirga sp. E12]MBO3696810.1 TetR/AcrR family transcriptional regulator [Roseivirga sp. E12]